MTSGCVRWLLTRTATAVFGGSGGGWTPASRSTMCIKRSGIAACQCRWSPFCTAAEDSEQTPPEKKKKQKSDPRARATVNSVGRKIPQRQILVISETGENLGTMHRADVIRIMDEKDLKLVLLSDNKDPPVYQLMRGQQVHEEQLKLREKQKAKAAPVQVKELSFSCGIAAHDLTTKLKQAESWLDKKHHVKITLRAARGKSADNLDATLDEMVQQMGVLVGFVSKPKVKREGRAAMCILRPPSAKELAQKEKRAAAADNKTVTVETAEQPERH